jgi:hypothetical protein
MKNSEARKQARAEMETLLCTMVCPHFHGVKRKGISNNYDAYICYALVGSDANTRADDDVLLREITVAVDVFSKRSFDTEENETLLEILEEKLMQNGFEVEIAEELFEDTTGLYHYPITAYKIY